MTHVTGSCISTVTRVCAREIPTNAVVVSHVSPFDLASATRLPRAAQDQRFLDRPTISENDPDRARSDRFEMSRAPTARRKHHNPPHIHPERLTP